MPNSPVPPIDHSPASHRIARLGAVIAFLALTGLLMPFMTFRTNRIVPGDALPIIDALPLPAAIFLHGTVFVACALAVLRVREGWHLLGGMAAIATLGLMLGVAANHLTPDGDLVSRTGPASGFWLMVFAFALMVADALARLRPGPHLRLGLLLLAALVGAGILWGEVWRDVSILREHANRSDAFRTEAWTHIALSLGSLGGAVLAGVPLGIACHRIAGLRAGVLNILNVIQTIPSLALFGLLIAPLGWIAVNLPGAAALGISGIGFAPALVALFCYSLLPIVANTLAGLETAPATAKDAARGMGMTQWQVLTEVELPLALPVLLAGIRIVLVQNIGLATIAALIGGGGFGVFVFQGIGQAAMDLVLLGAIPTVALAIGAAILMDAATELSQPGKGGP